MKPGESVLALVAGLALMGPASAQPAPTMPVQGVVRDNTGAVVQQGSFEMTFRLYPAADVPVEDALWSETHPSGDVNCAAAGDATDCVTVEDGVFVARLGAFTPLEPELFEQHETLWLGISVEGEPELPRRMLGASGRAMHAAVASDVTCSGCIEAKDVGFQTGTWSLSGDDVHRGQGNVGIGTDSPTDAADAGRRTLHVRDTQAGAELRLDAGSTDFTIDATPTGPGALVGTRTDDGLTFTTADTPRMALSADGRLGVGTQSPTTRLDVEGEVRLGSSGKGCGGDREGAVRYNASEEVLEFCNGGNGWVEVISISNLSSCDDDDNVVFDGATDGIRCQNTPAAFGFADESDEPTDTQITSDPITVQGISNPATISISDPGHGTAEYRVNSGSWTSSDGEVDDGDTVTLRLVTSSANGQTRKATLKVGGRSATWAVTTLDTAYATADLASGNRDLVFLLLPAGEAIASNAEYRSYCEDHGFAQNQNADNNPDYVDANMYNSSEYYCSNYCCYLGSGNGEWSNVSSFSNVSLPTNTALRVIDRGCGDYGGESSYVSGVNTTDRLVVNGPGSASYTENHYPTSCSSDHDYSCVQSPTSYPQDAVVVCQEN